MRHQIVLPDIEYPAGFEFPALKNRLSDYPAPERFARWGSLSKGVILPMHGFVDDWRIEAIWRDKYKSLDKVASSGVAVAPDYTVEVDDPSVYAFYQVWRSRVVARYWQDCGVFSIPALQWSRPELNHSLFSGLKDCEVVAVRSPTRGTVKEWVECVEQYLIINKPLFVLHFGTKNGLYVWTDNGIDSVNLNLR